MTSEALYEQYKDALRRGHVASLRGRIDDALLAYAEAARIAPERSTPHASAGTALLRLRRPAEALAHYEVALSIAPRDETALLGRAQSLAAMARRGEAADAFDLLAEVRAGGGRLADAVDAARRGLELAEGRERRRTLERLIARLRAGQPDEPARAALERALHVLDGRAMRPAPAQPPAAPEPGAAAVADAQGPAARAAEEAGLVVEAPGPAAPAEADAAEVAAVVGRESEPPPSPGPPPPREIPAGATANGLSARAEAAVEAGVPEAAVEALLDLAALHAGEGRVEAALDACYAALSFDPDSVPLHLALVQLYAERGWDALMTEKLDLLERLARLDGDEGAIADISGLRAARG
jgi:tetratricopeptide (TPR) repeat protein